MSCSRRRFAAFSGFAVGPLAMLIEGRASWVDGRSSLLLLCTDARLGSFDPKKDARLMSRLAFPRDAFRLEIGGGGGGCFFSRPPRFFFLVRAGVVALSADCDGAIADEAIPAL